VPVANANTVQLHISSHLEVCMRGVDDTPHCTLQVVGHVAVRLNRVAFATGHVEPDLDRRLRLADVPRDARRRLKAQ